MLAIPFGGWDSGYQNYTSQMKLYDIDVKDGIKERGSVDHSHLFHPDATVDYGCYDSAARVRRGVFIGEFLYSLSNGGVVVNELAGMSQVASVPLPTSPSAYGCYYY